MATLDDRNKPVDPYNLRRSIDDCSGEEWDNATKAFWNKMEEDPKHSRHDEIFSGSIFDKACDAWLDDDDEIPQEEDTYKMIEEEERFEQIVQILGPYYAISYCHGAALDILMNIDTAHHSSKKIEEAKVHLSRMARLINETEGVNW